MRITLKCAYCGSRISSVLSEDKRPLKWLLEDNTMICTKCAKDKDARIWFSNYILNYDK